MRAFLSLFLPLLISSLHAEKIITNPNWVARNTPVVTVDSILLRDTVSRMYITLKQLPHTSLTIHDDWVVQDSMKRFSGKVRDIDGVDFNRIFQFDSDSTIHIEMDFPALPPSLTEVDIIGNQKSNEIRIIGLSLTEKRNKTSIYPQPNPIYRSATPAITLDTAILQGKFVGYHKRLNLPDGKIIQDDLFSGKQTEINIPIAPDGSFSAKIPTRYPIQQKLIFGDRYIPFYIEPTDTLYIETYLDELFAPYRYSGEIEQNCVHSTYRGKNARINYELREIRLKNISETEDWIKSLNTLSTQKYYTSEENKFKVIDKDGKEIEFEVLFTFESDETKKNYMVYTDNSTDEEGNVRVYASVFKPDAEPLELLPVETEREWKIIETIITSITEESKKEKKEDK